MFKGEAEVASLRHAFDVKYPDYDAMVKTEAQRGSVCDADPEALRKAIEQQKVAAASMATAARLRAEHVRDALGHGVGAPPQPTVQQAHLDQMLEQQATQAHAATGAGLHAQGRMMRQEEARRDAPSCASARSGRRSTPCCARTT